MFNLYHILQGDGEKGERERERERERFFYLTHTTYHISRITHNTQTHDRVCKKYGTEYGNRYSK